MASPETSNSGQDSSGGLSGTSLSLYNGWMTGWSYEACRHLYFLHDGDPEALSAVEKFKLLSWLSTYRNLIDE